MKPSIRVWDVWLAAVVGSFAALEVYSLRTDRFPTLTRTLRAHLGIAPRARHGLVAPVAFLMFWAWLTAHLVELQIRWVRRNP